MIRRNGFISNSSSCSFLVDMGRPIKNEIDFIKASEGLNLDMNEAVEDWDMDSDTQSYLEPLTLLKCMWETAEEEKTYCTVPRDEEDVSYADACNKLKEPEDILKCPEENRMYFDFSSTLDFDNKLTFTEQLIENYGLGHKIFKDRPYVYFNSH